MQVRIKRAYELPGPDDGKRILVDRLWPRGLSKDRAKIDWWCKEIAPSPALRTWYGHDPKKWQEFVARYTSELQENTEAVTAIMGELQAGPATLIYAARDTAHCHTLVLQQYLEQVGATL